MIALIRRFLAAALLPLLALVPSTPTFALRVPQDLEARQLLEAGLEEPPAPLFVQHGPYILERNQRVADISGDYPLKHGRHYAQYTIPRLRAAMGRRLGFKRVPAVELPGVDQVVGKPVSIWCAAAAFAQGIDHGSWKPFLGGPYVAYYHFDKSGANGDRYNLLGRAGLPPVEEIVLQSTGNQADFFVNEAYPRIKRRVGVLRQQGIFWPLPRLRVFVGRGISGAKKRRLSQNGAIVDASYADYGDARLAIEQLLKSDTEQKILYVRHGDKVAVTANMAGGLMLDRDLRSDPKRRGKRIGVILPAGAGGGAAGFAAALSQLGNYVIILAETHDTDPIFQGFVAGHPVQISLRRGVSTVGGIGVDAGEGPALKVLQATTQVIAREDEEVTDSFSRWLWLILADHQWVVEGQTRPLTPYAEGVTGMSLAVLVFLSQECRNEPWFQEIDEFVIVQSGVNVGDAERARIESAPLDILPTAMRAQLRATDRSLVPAAEFSDVPAAFRQVGLEDREAERALAASP